MGEEECVVRAVMRVRYSVHGAGIYCQEEIVNVD